jgi:hypothetical protein
MAHDNPTWGQERIANELLLRRVRQEQFPLEPMALCFVPALSTGTNPLQGFSEYTQSFVSLSSPSIDLSQNG